MARRSKDYIPSVYGLSWYHKLSGDLATAQERFKQEYGFAHDDPVRVDAVILKLFRYYASYCGKEVDDLVSALLGGEESDTIYNATGDTIFNATVPIPTVLLLALILRKGFARGKGEKGFETWLRRRRIEGLVYQARDLVPKYLKHRNRYTLARAKEEAAKEVLQKRSIASATLFGDVRDITVQDIVNKDAWNYRHRPSRAKKTQQPV
jgi:hypothetical protein